MSNYSIDEDFLESLGIDLVSGRNFSPDIASDYGNAFILNETAVKKLGIDDPIGKPFTWREAKVTPGSFRIRLRHRPL